MRRILAIALALSACAPSTVANAPTRTSSPPVSAMPSPTSSPPSPTRTAPAAPTAPPTPWPTAVRFVDLHTGWLGMSDGILASIDGGTTWTRQLSGVGVARLWAYDAKHAWALSGGDLYRTVDGVGWSSAPLPAPGIGDLQFVTSSVGWLVTTQPTPVPFTGREQLTGSLFESVDGGGTWEKVSPVSIWSMCFLDARNGWGADGKTVLKTADGGRSWTKLVDLAITDDGPWYPTIRCADATNARVQVTEPNAALSHAPYLMFRTTDGGKSWLLEYREPYTLGATTPSSTPQLGSYPSTFDTFGDGSTWLVTCTPPMDRQDFLVLSRTGAELARGMVPFASCVVDGTFVDARDGWIIGPEFRNDHTENVLSRTTDSAQTWTRVYPP